MKKAASRCIQQQQVLCRAALAALHAHSQELCCNVMRMVWADLAHIPMLQIADFGLAGWTTPFDGECRGCFQASRIEVLMQCWQLLEGSASSTELLHANLPLISAAC